MIGIVLIAAALCVGILGICSGGSVPANQEIIKSKVQELDMIPTIAGHLTAEDLLEQAESDGTVAVIVSAAIALVLAGVGVLLILKGKKPR